MSCLKLKLLKQANAVQSNHESPINRSRVLGWADEVLSKLKSDRNFLRQTVKKTKYEGENANVDSNAVSSKDDKPVEEGISQLNSNEAGTCVSEIVASKMKRKMQHMTFDGSIMREKQKSKASGKEHVTNTEADENCDKQYKSKSKHEFNVSCNEDQECDLCRHEMCIRNRNRRKYNEGKSQKYFADSTCSESAFSDFKERSRKKKKLAEHYRYHGVSCCHFCKCASKEIGSQKVKKCEMPQDFHADNENDSASENVEDATSHRQEKIKKLKHTLDGMLGKGDQLSDRDVPKEDRKEKKKVKRYYKHSVSEECISEKKKLKKYKLYTEKTKSDESRCISERENKMSDREKEAFEGCCCLGERGERKKNKHDHAFNEKWEEIENRSFWRSSCKTEFASSRNEQKNVKENSHNTVEYKRKRKREKGDAYIESEIISERTKGHSDHGYYILSDSEPERKKKRKQEKQNCKVNKHVLDFEEMGKKKIYSDRSFVNAMEDSCIREKQKKKHREKEKCYNFSVDIEGQNKKNKKHKKHTDDNLQTGRSDVNPEEVSSTQAKQKKKHREVEKENYCNLSVDKEEGSKKKQKKIHKQEDRNEVNAIEASSVQEKRKKHKKAEIEKYYNLSVDREEESKKNRKKKRHEESAGIENNLKTDNNDVNAMEASSVQEKRKKKHRETEKEKCCSLSVDIQEESKKNRKKKMYEENTGTEDINAMEASSVQEKRKKKHKKAEREKCYNLLVDIEEERKKSRKKKRHEENLKTDRNDINAMKAYSVQEKQKKKHKKVEKCNSLSVDNEEENIKKRGKENVSTDNSLKTDEFMEEGALLDGASSNTKCSVKRQTKCCNTSQSQTKGMESVKPKINKALSVVPNDKTGSEITGSATMEDGMQYQKSDQCPESMQSESSFKEDKRNYMQLNALHDKNIKQSRKTSNFGLSPIFRLLATEPDFNNTIHTCQTCCRCKQHPDVTPSESAGSLTGNVSNVVIKIEPGIMIKQEKEDFDDSDPHIMDQQVLAVKQESQTEQSTDSMNKTDDAVRNVDINDISIDNLTGKEEDMSTGNGIGPNDYSVVKEGMGINETDNEYGVEEYVEDVNDECVGNGNAETDIDTPFHNMYDDKITVKEEIFHLTNVCYQSESRTHTEATSAVNFDYMGKKRTDYEGNISELSSVGVLGSTYNTVRNMRRTPSVQEVNGLNLAAMTKCEPVSLNEPVNSFSLDVIPEATDVQNTAWNGEEASSLYRSSLNRNEQQMPQPYDVRTFKIGRVNFTYVPKWWKRGKIAKVLGVPLKAVHIYSNHYGSRSSKNYVSVTFINPQCLQKIISHAEIIPCSEWFVGRGLEHWTRVRHRRLRPFHH